MTEECTNCGVKETTITFAEVNLCMGCLLSGIELLHGKMMEKHNTLLAEIKELVE